MKVILQKNIPHLGLAGQIKEVKDGYARNYLLPQKLVIPVTEHVSLSNIRQRPAEKPAASDLAGLADKTITLHGKAAGTTLYAGLTGADLQQAIKQQLGLEIAEKNLKDYHNIKELGSHRVELKDGQRSLWLTVNVRAE